MFLNPPDGSHLWRSITLGPYLPLYVTELPHVLVKQALSHSTDRSEGYRALG